MDWETINGVTGIISAICAIISLIYMLYPKRTKTQTIAPNRLIPLDNFIFFLLATSGWVLCCLAYLWFFEPFGRYPLDYNYKQFYGVLLSFPAITLFITGFKYMKGNNAEESRKEDAQQ